MNEIAEAINGVATAYSTVSKPSSLLIKRLMLLIFLLLRCCSLILKTHIDFQNILRHIRFNEYSLSFSTYYLSLIFATPLLNIAKFSSCFTKAIGYRCTQSG